MTDERRATINGEILIGDNCDFEELVKDIFACFEKYDAKPNFKIIEIIESEEEKRRKAEIRNMIERRKKQLFARNTVTVQMCFTIKAQCWEYVFCTYPNIYYRICTLMGPQ